MRDVRMRATCYSIFRSLGIVSLVSLASLGCSGSSDQFPTAKVIGKVTADGKPVTGGTITFAPVSANGKPPGKGGIATITSDGSYTVSTYGTGDGAVVGKHQLIFVAPPEQAPAPGGEHAQAAPSAFVGLTAKPAEITVAKGENKIDIELVKQAPPAGQ